MQKDTTTETVPWQNSLKSWVERLAFLHNNEKCSDCCFIISEGETKVKIPSHKFVLAASSKEFENLFYLMEAESNEIHITNYSIVEFQSFLSFIYKGNSHTFDPWAMLKFAKHYAVTNLEQECYKRIVSDEKIFQLPSFLYIERDCLEKVLQMDNLPASEIDIYRAVNLWSETFCKQNNQQITSKNKRSALGSAMKWIRFGVMTAKQFYECSEDKHCFLNDEEKLNTFKCISSGKIFQCEFSSVTRKDMNLKKRQLRPPIFFDV